MNATPQPVPHTPLEAMLVSVGGSPEPVVASISRQRPKRLILFVSPGSRASAEQDVLPALPADYRYLEIAWIETPSAELLDESYATLRHELGLLLPRWQVPWTDLRADFTGGTKVMSAAVVLALAPLGVSFSYVGSIDSTARDKGGLGVVVSGKEKVLWEPNPWGLLALDRIREAMALVGQGRLQAADAVLPERGMGRAMHLVESLRLVLRGLAEWDRQRYAEAWEALETGVEDLSKVLALAATPAQTRFLDECRSALAALRAVHGEWKRFTEALQAPPSTRHLHTGRFQGLDGRAIPLDLCAAAVRRAELGDDAEDGVMLLYAAIEKLAKGRLLACHALDSSRIPTARLGGLELEFARKYGHPLESGCVQLPLNASFQLLRELGDEVGQRFADHEPAIRDLLSARNYCWREHGYSHVQRSTFDSLLPRVLSFIGAERDALVRFPDGLGW